MNNTLPSSTLTLYKVVCDPTYQNVWGFKTKDELDNYLARCSPHTFVNSLGSPDYLYYIRRNATIDIPMLFDDCEQYTYCKYNNNENSGDEYAFIVDKKFINMNCTRLVLQYDTWINYRILSGFDMSTIHGLVERKLSYDLNYLSDVSSNVKTMIYEQTFLGNSNIMTYVTYDPLHFNVTTTNAYDRMITEDKIGGAVFFFDSSDWTNLRLMLASFSSSAYVYAVYIMAVSDTCKNAITTNSQAGTYSFSALGSATISLPCRLPNYSRNRFNTNNGIAWTDEHVLTIPYNNDNKKILTMPYTTVQLNMFGNDYPIDMTLLPFESQTETSYSAQLNIRNVIAFTSNDVYIESEIEMKKGKMKLYNSIGTIAKTEDRAWNALNSTLSTLFNIPAQGFSTINASNKANYLRPDRDVMMTPTFDLQSLAVNAGTSIIANSISAYIQPDSPVYGSSSTLNKLKCGGNGNKIARFYMPIDSEIDRIIGLWNMIGYPEYIYDSALNNFHYYNYIKYANVSINLATMCLDERVKLQNILTSGVGIYYSPLTYNYGMIPSATSNITGV